MVAQRNASPQNNEQETVLKLEVVGPGSKIFSAVTFQPNGVHATGPIYMKFPLCVTRPYGADFIRRWLAGIGLVTLGNEGRVTGVICGRAQNEPSFWTDAQQSGCVRVRVRNGNYLEGAVVVKKVCSGKIYISGPNDLASVGNTNESGKRGIGIIQRCPLAFAKNEAVN